MKKLTNHTACSILIKSAKTVRQLTFFKQERTTALYHPNRLSVPDCSGSPRLHLTSWDLATILLDKGYGEYLVKYQYTDSDSEELARIALSMGRFMNWTHRNTYDTSIPNEQSVSLWLHTIVHTQYTVISDYCAYLRDRCRVAPAVVKDMALHAQALCTWYIVHQAREGRDALAALDALVEAIQLERRGEQPWQTGPDGHATGPQRRYGDPYATGEEVVVSHGAAATIMYMGNIR